MLEKMTKEEARQFLKSLYKSLSQPRQEALCLDFFKNAAAKHWPFFLQSNKRKNTFLYLTTKQRFWELDLSQAMQWLLEMGHNVFVPNWSEGKEMCFFRVLSLAHVSQFTSAPGSSGIAVPTVSNDNQYSVGRFGPVDAVFVPGLAFDQYGSRIGSGFGYYDRFLATIADCEPVIIGVCADMAVYSGPLQQYETDISADFLLTNHKIIKTEKNK